MRSTPRRCPPPRRWRTSPSCWCSHSWGRPGARRDSRSRRRRQTFGGNSGRRTRSSARQYCKVVRPKVQQYAHLLLEWNRSINLTGARTLEEVEALIDDAGVLVEASWGGITRVIDIGSGGGLPAIPLAVEMPHIQFTLLEANARKCAFLEHAAGTLGLANIRVAPGRAEELGHQPALREQFDRAISRAAARPEELLELALPFVRTGGDLVAQVSPLDPLVLEPAARLLGGGIPPLAPPAAGHSPVAVPELVPPPARFPRPTGVSDRKPPALTTQ